MLASRWFSTYVAAVVLLSARKPKRPMVASALVEVFSVRIHIDNFHGDLASAGVGGRCIAHDIQRGVEIDFFEPMKGFVSVLPGGRLALTGPFRCLEVDGYAGYFKLLLKAESSDLEICKGSYYFDANFCAGYLDHTPLSAVASGERGYAVLNFMRLTNAVQATIKFVLDDDAAAAAACGDSGCHGFIHAKHDTTYFDNDDREEDFTITLFYAPEKNPLKPMGDTNELPLLRSVVAVPIGQSLVIQADLSGGTSKLATGSTSFGALLSGDSKGRIGGMEVNVTWAPDPFTGSGLTPPYLCVPKLRK